MKGGESDFLRVKKEIHTWEGNFNTCHIAERQVVLAVGGISAE